jgi:hypothetical protein
VSSVAWSGLSDGCWNVGIGVVAGEEGRLGIGHVDLASRLGRREDTETGRSGPKEVQVGGHQVGGFARCRWVLFAQCLLALSPME